MRLIRLVFFAADAYSGNRYCTEPIKLVHILVVAVFRVFARAI